MINFFDRLNSSIDDRNLLFKKLKFYSLFRFTIRAFVNIVAPFYFYLTQKNKKYSLEKCSKNQGRIIVSLTSFPNRINQIWLVIETILRQTKKPDKIILWLSKEQFSSLEDLPRKLLKQIDRGLEIELVDEDLKSHKKYYYTLQKYPNDFMLTIDDDIFYRSTMINDLYNYSNLFPNVVISQYCKQIYWVNNKLIPYSLWPYSKVHSETRSDLFFGTGGGTLFPPNSLHSDVLNKFLFMKYTKTADDIWLNVMCKLKLTKVVQTNYSTVLLPVLNFGNITLDNINNGLLNKNDECIKRLKDFYIKQKGINPFSSVH